MFDNTSGRNGTLEKWLVKKKKKISIIKDWGNQSKSVLFCFVFTCTRFLFKLLHS